MKYEYREEVRALVCEFRSRMESHYATIDLLTDDNPEDDTLLCLSEAVEDVLDECERLLNEEAL